PPSRRHSASDPIRVKRTSHVPKIFTEDISIMIALWLKWNSRDRLYLMILWYLSSRATSRGARGSSNRRSRVLRARWTLTRGTFLLCNRSRELTAGFGVLPMG